MAGWLRGTGDGWEETLYRQEEIYLVKKLNSKRE